MLHLRRPLSALLVGLCLNLAVLTLLPGLAAAAQVLQVRSANLLQVGDSNRSYSVELACISPHEQQRDQALAWLRQQLPRHTRVNLRPIGNRDGILLARVQKLGAAEDVSLGLIQAGLADPLVELPACR